MAGSLGRMRHLLLSAVLLAGCVDGETIVLPTPYQAYVPHQHGDQAAGGYITAKLARDTYLVTFRGTTATPADEVIAYAYQQAAEVCGGDDAFVVLHEEDVSRTVTETETRAYVAPRWGIGRARSESYDTVWPRRRLTVRCKSPEPNAPR